MKENRLGPRQWAFVVVTGGTVFALPFMQRQTDPKPEPPVVVVDVEATLLPEASIAAHSAGTANGLLPTSASASPAPTWPTLPHSPFDDLVQQKAIVPEAKPAEEIVPMLPLRPWISAPNMSASSSSNSLASTQASSSSSLPGASTTTTTTTSTSTVANSKNAVAMASPWRDDGGADVAEATQVAQSYGHGRRQLPVNAGPADQYTHEEIAQKLNLPKQELVSAIVPADQVLPAPLASPPPPGNLAAQSVPSPRQPSSTFAPRSTSADVPKSSVVLGRQPTARTSGAQIRFGQANEPATAGPNSSSTMAPLPTLPAERRGHIIMQPIRQ